MNANVSRFITVDDPKTEEFFYTLPASWWSRIYEYEWLKNFVGKEDIVLDAASGMIHPSQFYLADRCKKVYVCDNDERIISEGAILEMAKEELGEEASKLKKADYFTKISRTCCSITKLPYENNSFDKIYCISVLEHLKDWFNKGDDRAKFMSMLGPFLKKDIYDSLREFRRTLKDEGLIILTFDYPKINLGYLNEIIDKLELKFAGEVDFNLPGNAIRNNELGLNCFRAVLQKKLVATIT